MIRFKPLELVVAAFLLILFVQYLPFSPRTAIDAAALDAEVGGNLARQLLYVAAFALILLRARREAMALLRRPPVALALLFAFATLSLAWSAVPGIGGRRLAATLLVGAAMLVAGAALRPARTVALLRGVTLVLAIATLVSGLAAPLLAIHQPGDPEPSIVGAWRGVFFHKNMAGSAIALGLVLALDRWWAMPRRPLAIVAVATCAVALILTRSKSSEAAVLLAALTMLGVRATIRLSRGDPAGGVLLRAAVAAAGAVVVVVAWWATPLGDYLLDPDAFTGRGRLWQTVGDLIARRPLAGWGFASVFQVGEDGPLAAVAPSAWVRNVAHSHNGLLDLAVTLGAIGVVLALWALFVDPWRRVARLLATVRDEWQPLVAGLLCFAFVQGLMEGGLMAAGGVKWALLTLLVGVTLRLAAAARPTPRRR